MLILWDQWLENYKWGVVVGLFGVIALGVGIFLYRSEADTPEIQILSSQDEASVSAETFVYIDVSGAVKSPGVYKLTTDSRVEDALSIAGGFTNKVDYKWIEKNLNRAERIRDGMKLYIPAENEAIYTANADNTITASSKIDLNSATLQELELLKGIGPVTAQKIIDNRPYSKVQDLLTKKVIGSKVFESIENELVAW
jgi:competence protein ComEA